MWARESNMWIGSGRTRVRERKGGAQLDPVVGYGGNSADDYYYYNDGVRVSTTKASRKSISPMAYQLTSSWKASSGPRSKKPPHPMTNMYQERRDLVESDFYLRP